MLPTFLLTGLGFALAFGPLNIAATNGVAPGEQGLAGGLLNTSFQFGGALALAVVTAVLNANTVGGTPQDAARRVQARPAGAGGGRPARHPRHDDQDARALGRAGGVRGRSGRGRLTSP